MLAGLFKLHNSLPNFRGKWRLTSFFQRRLRYFRRIMKPGFEMELDCNEWIQLQLAKDGEVEVDLVLKLNSLLKRGGVFVDIGAHVGFTSLVARHLVGEEGTVVALEPQPYNCEKILRNWELNRFNNLHLLVAAAGDRDGFVRLPQQASTDKARLSLAIKMADALDLDFTVPIRQLNNIPEVASLASIDVMKIDVEGFEMQVLQGASQILDRTKHVIFESLWDSEENRQVSRNVCLYLQERGFQVACFDGECWTEAQARNEPNLIASKV